MPSSTPALVADGPSRGDFYGGWRLAEAQLVAQDKQGQKHPLNITGRYLTCSVHQNPLVAGMSGFNAESTERLLCTQLAKTWNQSFRPGKQHQGLETTFLDPAFPIANFLDPAFSVANYKALHRLSEHHRQIQATIIERIREQTIVALTTADSALQFWPELWDDPDWMSGHQKVGVYAEDWAMMKKLGLQNELAPLARIDRPNAFSLTRMFYSNHRNFETTPAAQALFWQQAAFIAKRALELRQKISLHLITTPHPSESGVVQMQKLCSLLQTNPVDRTRLLTAAWKNYQDANLSPRPNPAIPPLTREHWNEQGLFDSFQIQVAALFQRVTPWLTAAEVAHLASNWEKRHSADYNSIIYEPQKAKLAVKYQQAGYGPINPEYNDPEPVDFCPIENDQTDRVHELALRPDQQLESALTLP